MSQKTKNQRTSFYLELTCGYRQVEKSDFGVTAKFPAFYLENLFSSLQRINLLILLALVWMGMRDHWLWLISVLNTDSLSINGYLKVQREPTCSSITCPRSLETRTCCRCLCPLGMSCLPRFSLTSRQTWASVLVCWFLFWCQNGIKYFATEKESCWQIQRKLILSLTSADLTTSFWASLLSVIEVVISAHSTGPEVLPLRLETKYINP